MPTQEGEHAEPRAMVRRRPRSAGRGWRGAERRAMVMTSDPDGPGRRRRRPTCRRCAVPSARSTRRRWAKPTVTGPAMLEPSAQPPRVPTRHLGVRAGASPSSTITSMCRPPNCAVDDVAPGTHARCRRRTRPRSERASRRRDAAGRSPTSCAGSIGRSPLTGRRRDVQPSPSRTSGRRLDMPMKPATYSVAGCSKTCSGVPICSNFRPA